MAHSTIWRIGTWLNLVQTTFVGLLRVWSVPIVVLLSIASGYTTYYGLSYFITPWIALTVTIAVQSIVVICSLELAGMHWQANPIRYFSVILSLLVALIVSISFSYFKFYEFSQRDILLASKHAQLSEDIHRYLSGVITLKSQLTAEQQNRIERATSETTQAYLGSHPGIQDTKQHVIGRGKVWNYYNEILQTEQGKLQTLHNQFHIIEKLFTEVRYALQAFSSVSNDPHSYETLTRTFHRLESEVETLATMYGVSSVTSPEFGSYAQFSKGLSPSFSMWKDISWFALACAAMVDFFTLVLSYRLECTAPGPLTEEEKELAFQGIRQFSEFTINRNDELEFIIERTELERARRVSDWNRLFIVALLLNRGYLRKLSERSVEFAPNLYPILVERMTARKGIPSSQLESANEGFLSTELKRKQYG